MNYPSPRQLAKEAHEALARDKETPDEHIERLIKLGFINSKGEVTTLLGGTAEPEVPLNPDGTPVHPVK